MNKIIDLIYSAVAYIGKFPVILLAEALKRLKNIFKHEKKNKKFELRYNKRYAEIAIISFVVLAVIATSVVVVNSNSSKVSAIRLKIDDTVIGYANSQTEVDVAKAYALKVLGETSAVQIQVDEVRTEANNIKTASALSDKIIEYSGDKLVPVYEIYLSNNLLCAVTDVTQARKAVAEVYELTKKLYPESAVSFSQGITFVPTKYAEGNNNIYSVSDMKSKLGSQLKFIHAQCEENITQTQYDTVEVQTNTLFIGDSRVRREGENGSEYKVSLVKYINNQKIMSEHLLSYPITDPITKIVERGTRAQSLTMGSYTVYQTAGMFCWPVVDLYRVTSPFGPRRLGNHRGIDISGANASGKLIVAAAGGTVIKAGWNNGGYGNHVVIDHGNGIETLYAHMLDNSIMVNVGDRVQRGQTIGRVGNTGNSFGAHLHFEVMINGNKYDPAPYLGLQ